MSRKVFVIGVGHNSIRRITGLYFAGNYVNNESKENQQAPMFDMHRSYFDQFVVRGPDWPSIKIEIDSRYVGSDYAGEADLYCSSLDGDLVNYISNIVQDYPDAMILIPHRYDMWLERVGDTEYEHNRYPSGTPDIKTKIDIIEEFVTSNNLPSINFDNQTVDHIDYSGMPVVINNTPLEGLRDIQGNYSVYYNS
jgi:hypothetical protein